MQETKTAKERKTKKKARGETLTNDRPGNWREKRMVVKRMGRGEKEVERLPGKKKRSMKSGASRKKLMGREVTKICQTQEER